MKKQGKRSQLVGTVISDKMDKTVIVRVERLEKHRLYKKYIKKQSKFAAHDEKNDCKIGDKIVITASKPLSRMKRWRVSTILAKAV